MMLPKNNKLRGSSGNDLCTYGRGYRNGVGPIFSAQFFTLLGGLLSAMALIDCSFAMTNRITSFDLRDGLEIEATGVGFVFFQKTDGDCYWYNDDRDSHTKNQLRLYWTILGDTWTIASGLAWFCCSFLYSLSFCCSSQVKQCRYLNGFVLAVVLTICQACTFVVYGSDFCERNGCAFSRGSAYSIVAMLCYVVAGTGFFLSRDYPGEEPTIPTATVMTTMDRPKEAPPPVARGRPATDAFSVAINAIEHGGVEYAPAKSRKVASAARWRRTDPSPKRKTREVAVVLDPLFDPSGDLMYEKSRTLASIELEASS